MINSHSTHTKQTTKKISTKTPLAIACALLPLLAAPSGAASESAAVEEVIVTAAKREQRLHAAEEVAAERFVLAQHRPHEQIDARLALLEAEMRRFTETAVAAKAADVAAQIRATAILCLTYTKAAAAEMRAAAAGHAARPGATGRCH